MYLPESERKFIWLGEGTRLEICGRWQHSGITQSLYLQLDITPAPIICLDGMPEESFFLNITTNFKQFARHYWVQVLWSDETKIKLFGKKPLQTPHGLQEIPEHFNMKSWLPLPRKATPGSWLDQDGDLKMHLNWFNAHRMKHLTWPSRSPDLNLTEILWSTLEDLERLYIKESQRACSVHHFIKRYARRLGAVMMAQKSWLKKKSAKRRVANNGDTSGFVKYII